MKITTALLERLICPHCRSRLHSQDEFFICENCGKEYPVVAGIPILIDEAASGFPISNYKRPQPLSRGERAKRVLKGALPAISMNLAARRNYERFCEMLFKLRSEERRV